MTECSTRRAVAGSLLVFLFVSVSLSPIVSQQWYGVMSIVALALTCAVVFTHDRTAAASALFCAVAVLSYELNPWYFWPMGLLVPLASFALLVGLIPPLRRALPSPPWGRFDHGTVILVTLTVLGSAMALVLWQQLLQPDLTDLQRQIPPVPAWVLPLAGLTFAVVNAVMEEAVWRWILWDLLTYAIGRAWIVVLLQAASFGLFHIHGFPRGWIGVGMAAVYGVVLGVIRYRSGGLGPPIVVHVFADLTIITILISISD